MIRLSEKMQKEIAPALEAKFAYGNVMRVPKISKVVVNVGFGRQAKEKAYVDNVVSGLTRITGQKPVLNKARKSVSAFKVRQGMVIGSSVTLRGRRMYDFLDKLFNVAFPRIRDFRGVSEKIVDRNGNLTVGFKEHISFPEIKADEVENVFGLEISIHTTAKTKEEGLELFRLAGFPFAK
jgi:large subunit ribosomal protein L5